MDRSFITSHHAHIVQVASSYLYPDDPCRQSAQGGVGSGGAAETLCYAFPLLFLPIPPPLPGVDPCSTHTIRLVITAPSLEWHFIDYRALSGIYQLFVYPDLMRIGDTTEIAVRSIPHSSSPPHPTPKGDITSGEWLLRNICSECMGLSYASGTVCSCAGQQSANPPPEELDCWAVVW